MPGMGLLMDGAVQQAAQWGRQCTGRPGAADQAGRRPALQPGSNVVPEFTIRNVHLDTGIVLVALVRAVIALHSSASKKVLYIV
jgi:hypothetical protein